MWKMIAIWQRKYVTEINGKGKSVNNGLYWNRERMTFGIFSDLQFVKVCSVCSVRVCEWWEKLTSGVCDVSVSDEFSMSSECVCEWVMSSVNSVCDASASEWREQWIQCVCAYAPTVSTVCVCVVPNTQSVTLTSYAALWMAVDEHLSFSLSVHINNRISTTNCSHFMFND